MTLYQKVLTAYGLISGSIATKMSEYAVAPEFNPNATYSAGMLVIRENVLYSCVVSHTGAWDPSHFSPSTVDEAIRYVAAKQVEESLGDVDRFAEKTDIAPEFDEDDAYAVGDMVIYENVLYRCTAAHAAGEFDIDHFSPSTVEEVLSAVQASVSAALALKANIADLPLQMHVVELDSLNEGQLLDRAVNYVDSQSGQVKLVFPPYFEGAARRFFVYLTLGTSPSAGSGFIAYGTENIDFVSPNNLPWPTESGDFLMDIVEIVPHVISVTTSKYQAM